MNLLAVNALIVTIVLIAGLAILVSFLIGRPLFRVVNKACDEIDHVQEARALQERLEREEIAHHRAQAEKELDEQFPHLKDVAE